MRNLIKNIGIAALLLTSVSVNAATVSVNFDVKMKWNGGTWGAGSFEGVDINSDGFLKFNELTSFTLGNNIENTIVNLTKLVSIGDFDISNNIWLNNGISWIGNPNNAFFTWNNRGNSVNSQWANVLTGSTTTGASPVPVPAAVWLFGSGLVGLMGAKRTKTSKSFAFA